MRRVHLSFLIAILAGATALAGCGVGHTQAARQHGAATVRAARLKLDAPKRVVAVRDSRRGAFDAARTQWLRAAAVFSSAAQGAPLELAIIDLRRRGATREHGAVEIRAAIARLHELQQLPDTDVSKHQARAANAEIAALDRFFGVSHWRP